MSETETDIHYTGTFDPTDEIKKVFGEDVVFLIGIRSGNDKVELRENSRKPLAEKDKFPKKDLKELKKPDQITVLDWSSSPGCKTVIINGRPYDKC